MLLFVSRSRGMMMMMTGIRYHTDLTIGSRYNNSGRELAVPEVAGEEVAVDRPC